MTSQQSDFENFYDDQVAAHRVLNPRPQPWDRLYQPSVLLSALFLAVATVYHFYRGSASLEASISQLSCHAWDALIYVTPASLLGAVDDWTNPSLFPRSMIQPQASTHAAKSETMRRILGLDHSGGMMASVIQARTRALSVTGSVLGLKLDSERPPGLGNRDNSCYQNSILQGLAALQPFPDYLSLSARNADIDDDTNVAQTLRALISDLNDATNNGKTLWTPYVLKSMSTWTQQDAQEYYSKILDDIDKGFAKAMKPSQRQHLGLEADIGKDETATSQYSDDSGYSSQSSTLKPSDTGLTRNPLEGLLAQRVACVQCGHSDGLSMIPFNCLTLSLGLDQSQYDLYERLDSYTKVEAIEGVECPKCTLLKAQRLLTKLVEKFRESDSSEEQLAEPVRRLEAVETALEEDDFEEETISGACKISSQGKVSTTKTKQIVIARPPQSLAIHMNRSVFDPSTFAMMKNSAPVNFPTTLDLGPWCLGSTENATNDPSVEPGASAPVEDEEQWLLNPTASMVAGDLRPSRLTGPIYELRAAVTHYGRHENGHYICYRRFPRNKVPGAEPAREDKASMADAESDDVADANPDSSADDVEKPTEGKTYEPMDLEWWRLSDHNVTKVDEQAIAALSPGVFMLFYDCVDANVVLNSEELVDAPEAMEESQATLHQTGSQSGEADRRPETKAVSPEGPARSAQMPGATEAVGDGSAAVSGKVGGTLPTPQSAVLPPKHGEDSEEQLGSA